MQMMKNIHRSLRRFRRCDYGVAYFEFALSAPVLALLLLGSVEVTRYVLITQKVEKTAITISDLAAQETTAKTSILNNDLIASQQVMLPYNFNNNGFVIISSVTQTGAQTAANPPIINWQYAGGGTMVETSQIGTVGQKATLPAGFTLNDKDNIIVTEVYYKFTPLLNNIILGPTNLYRMALFRPRLGVLTTLING